jgi:hypothetical protein
MVLEGGTSEGQWTGRVRDTFEVTEADVASHEHAEAFVVLAPLEEGSTDQSLGSGLLGGDLLTRGGVITRLWQQFRMIP